MFQTRCPRKIGAICETIDPPLLEAEPGHAIACHIPIEELARLQHGVPGGSANGRDDVSATNGEAVTSYPLRRNR